LRAVATTLSPRFRNASAQSLPNPRDAPVIKIVFAIVNLLKLNMIQSYTGQPRQIYTKTGKTDTYQGY
jgi:hypothetical protein